MLKTRNVVCYHYPCIDGIYSALAAHLHFRQRGEPVRFFPLTVFKDHTSDELELQGKETVYLCDFCGPPGFAMAAAAQADRLVVLDHHKTSFEMLKAPGVVLPANMELHMTMEHSGATIALDFFKPDVSPELAQAFRFVEDGDLWSWKLAGSREFYSGLGALGLEYDCNKNPAIFDVLQGLSVEELMASGKLAMEAEASFIASCLERAFSVQLGGEMGRAQGWGQGLAVQIDDSMSKHRSRLGNELAELAGARGLKPIGVIAYREEGMDGASIKLSIRGTGDGTDTTPISEAFGGGGHRLASSCIVPNGVFDSWK